MNQDQRQQLLRQAENEYRQARRDHGWNSPQAAEAHRQQLEVQRRTAAEMGLPYAERLDLGVKWDTGAPMPILIAGLRTFVAFYLSIHDPLFDGTNPIIRDPRADHGIGIVEFTLATSVKMGDPNDEVLNGHPLWGSGLEYYESHVVKDSPWIKELMDINRVHTAFRESNWTEQRHFVLAFHDETVECIARAAVARTEPDATMPAVVAQLSSEALG